MTKNKFNVCFQPGSELLIQYMVCIKLRPHEKFILPTEIFSLNWTNYFLFFWAKRNFGTCACSFVQCIASDSSSFRWIFFFFRFRFAFGALVMWWVNSIVTECIKTAEHSTHTNTHTYCSGKLNVQLAKDKLNFIILD